MMEPTENPDGYAVSFTLSKIVLSAHCCSLLYLNANVCAQNSTVPGRAKNFHSVQYLLVHGTADGESGRVFNFSIVQFQAIYGYQCYS